MAKIRRWSIQLLVLIAAMRGAFPAYGQAVQPGPTAPADFSQRYAAIRVQLASTDFAQRQAGQKELDALSPDLLEALQSQAAGEKDPEIEARVGARLDAMAAYRLVHPPPLSVDFQNATLDQVAAELNGQLGTQSFSTRPPASTARYTLTAHQKPLLEIIEELNHQSPLSIVSQSSGQPDGTRRLALEPARAASERTVVDGFCYAVEVTGHTGSRNVTVSGFADPRVRVVEVRLHVDRLFDQDGQSLLPMATISRGSPAQVGAALATWTRTIEVAGAPGGKPLQAMHGSLTISVVEKEDSASFDLSRELSPVRTTLGTLSLERQPGSADIILHIEPPAGGGAPATSAGGLPQFTARLYDAQMQLIPRNEIISTSAGSAVTIRLSPRAAGAAAPARVELSWPQKTRDFTYPIDWPMPSTTTAPAGRTTQQ